MDNSLQYRNPRLGHKPAHRSKVTTACAQCRGRKSKCDGRRPVCSPCANRKNGPTAICTWDTKTDGRVRQKGSVAPKSGIRKPGDRLLSKAGAEYPLTPMSRSGQLNAASQTTFYNNDMNTEADRSDGSEDLRIDRASNQRGDLGEASRQAPYNISDQVLLGTASVGPLATNIQSSHVAGVTAENRPVHPFQTAALVRYRNIIFKESHHLGPNEAAFELPRRAKAVELFHIYSDVIHPIFPILNIEETQNTYDRICVDRSLGPQSSIFLAIVNSVFALASRLDPSIDSSAREEASARFCVRALELFNHRRSPHVSLQSIQAALLIGEFLHSIHPTQCLIHIGLAIRVAQSIGLHRVRSFPTTQYSEIELLMQRVWCLCVAWDRILCMTYGQPLMISQSQASVATLPAEILVRDADASHPDCKERMISLFLQKSVELYSVISGALEDFAVYDIHSDYGRSPTSQARNYQARTLVIDRVLVHERELSAWRDSLPECLSCVDVPDVAMSIPSLRLLQYRHAIILRQRYLQARIVLLRPVLANLIKLRWRPTGRQHFTDSDNLSQSIETQCAVSCVAAARDAISVIDTYGTFEVSGRHTIDDKYLNTWWNNVLYLFSASISLIAACICDEIVNAIGIHAVAESWKTALRLLHCYEEHGPWVQQLSDILKRLARKSTKGLLEVDSENTRGHHLFAKSPYNSPPQSWCSHRDAIASDISNTLGARCDISVNTDFPEGPRSPILESDMTPPTAHFLDRDLSELLCFLDDPFPIFGPEIFDT